MSLFASRDRSRKTMMAKLVADRRHWAFGVDADSWGNTQAHLPQADVRPRQMVEVDHLSYGGGLQVSATPFRPGYQRRYWHRHFSDLGAGWRANIAGPRAFSFPGFIDLQRSISCLGRASGSAAGRPVFRQASGFQHRHHQATPVSEAPASGYALPGDAQTRRLFMMLLAVTAADRRRSRPGSSILRPRCGGYRFSCAESLTRLLRQRGLTNATTTARLLPAADQRVQWAAAPLPQLTTPVRCRRDHCVRGLPGSAGDPAPPRRCSLAAGAFFRSWSGRSLNASRLSHRLWPGPA